MKIDRQMYDYWTGLEHGVLGMFMLIAVIAGGYAVLVEIAKGMCK